METIQFNSVLPDVFAHCPDMHSEVWNQQLLFRKNTLTLIEAASGMGKSTFCSYVLGYRHDYSGQILFDDNDTRRFRSSDWSRVRTSQVSMLFQELRLFPELTALENVLIKNRLTGYKSQEEISQWFDRLGIADKCHAKVGQMSFGQQQRVALMRALAQPFDFIVADEPISHLDDDNSAVMAELMMEEACRQGAGVIVTSIGKHMQLDYDRVVRL